MKSSIISKNVDLSRRNWWRVIGRLVAAGLFVFMGFGEKNAAGGWTRETTRDHKMADFEPPRVDLQRYKSVQSRPNQNKDLALAVAISGGGHRAANFAAGVLLALEQFSLNDDDDGEAYNLLKEVDYFSTVSGGGFPVGVYFATRYDHRPGRGYSFRKALKSKDERYLKNLRRDYQMTLLEAAFNPQCAGYKDAGDLLEEKFDDYMLGAEYRSSKQSLRLSDVFRADKTAAPPVELPYWFANATIYENGSRFVFTPGIIREYGITHCTHRMEGLNIEGKPESMPLAVGLKTSASFPVLIPATTMHCKAESDPLNPYLHLIDGGLVDNQGIFTAFEVLRQDPAKHKVLLVIDAYKGISHPRSRWRASPSGPEMAARIMKIALDSAHNRLDETIAYQRQLGEVDGKGGGIEVAMISFSTLKPETRARIDDLETEVKKIRKEKFKGFARRIRREVKALFQKDKSKEEGLVSDDISAMELYHDAHAVGTTLNITPAQQSLLLEAGHEAVEKQREFIGKKLLPRTR
ncbi:MAG: patatin-like phospholipase family protein [Lentisphaeria bacterium]